MNITKHARERWAERIRGVDKSFVPAYITQNEKQIQEDINKTFEASTLLYTGQISYSGGKASSKYFLKDSLVIITDTSEQNIITLYPMDYGFPEETGLDKTIRDALLKELDKVEGEITQSQSDFEDKLGDNEMDSNTVTNQLKDLEEQEHELTKRKRALEAEKRALDESRKVLRSGSVELNQKRKNLVSQLVNSKFLLHDMSEV